MSFSSSRTGLQTEQQQQTNSSNCNNNKIMRDSGRRSSFGSPSSISTPHKEGYYSENRNNENNGNNNNNGIDTPHRIELRGRMMESSSASSSSSASDSWKNQNYDETRAELKSIGHNLTSVLMNPRESMLDNLMDEFASEQSTPVDYNASLLQDSAMAIFNIFSTNSSSGSGSSSDYNSNNGSSTTALAGSNPPVLPQFTPRSPTGLFSPSVTSGTLALFPTVSDDSIHLRTLIRNMRCIFRDYQAVHDAYKQHCHSNSAAVVLTAATRPHSRRDEVISCFHLVPAVFFKHDFSLRDSDIFSQPSSNNNNSTTISKTSKIMSNSQNNSLVQDRLSTYLDTVETALFKQIWTRSPDFFKALDDISGLRIVVSEACKTLTTMRSRLRRMDSDVALTAMRIPLLQTRYKNELVLQHVFILIQRVKDNAEVVQSLLRVGDYVGALQLANETLRLSSNELKGVKCIHSIRTRLHEVEKSIGDKLVKRFVDLALEWQYPNKSSHHSAFNISAGGVNNSDYDDSFNNEASSPEKRAPATKTQAILLSLEPTNTSNANGNNNDTAAAAAAEAENINDPLNQIMSALLTSDLLDMAINEYKNRLCDNVRLVVRTCVTEYMSSFDPLTWSATLGDKLFDDSSNSGNDDTPFAQRVRAMNNEDFLSALSMCVENLLLSLQRTAAVHVTISRVSRAAAITATANNIHVNTITSSQDSTDNNNKQTQSTNGSIVDNGSTNSLTIDTTTATSSAAATTAVDGLSTPPLSLELSRECVIAACDLAQRSISQLLKIRRDNTSRLALEKMKFLSEMCRHFLASLDKIYHQQGIELITATTTTGSSVSSNNKNTGIAGDDENGNTSGASGSSSGPGLAYELSKTLRVQTRAYLDHLQDSHKQRLVSTLDADRWVQADATLDRQADVDRLVTGRALAFINSGSSSSFTSPNKQQMSASSTASSSSGDKNNKRETRAVMVDGVQYRVVWSCLLLCEQLISYLDIASSLVCVSPETVAKETIPKIVELLKLFDTRTRLLVLGAGAIQSAARLKSISAKHLAYTAQSLGLIKCLIPHIRAALLATLNAKHHMLLTELDRVANDYIDHHSLIVNKLVTIAGDSVDGSAQRLRAVDWDRFQGSAGGSANSGLSGGDYFDDIVRNISALHRVLQESLSLELLQDIFNRIFALLSRRILAHFEEYNIMPNTQTARQRLVDEIIKMTSALGRLKGVEAPAAMNTVVEAFQKRYINSNSSYSNNNSSNNSTSAATNNNVNGTSPRGIVSK